MKYLERFSKYPPKRPDKSFIKEIRLDRGTDLMNIMTKIHKFERLLQIPFKRTDIL